MRIELVRSGHQAGQHEQRDGELVVQPEHDVIGDHPLGQAGLEELINELHGYFAGLIGRSVAEVRLKSGGLKSDTRWITSHTLRMLCILWMFCLELEAHREESVTLRWLPDWTD